MNKLLWIGLALLLLPLVSASFCYENMAGRSQNPADYITYENCGGTQWNSTYFTTVGKTGAAGGVCQINGTNTGHILDYVNSSVNSGSTGNFTTEMRCRYGAGGEGVEFFKMNTPKTGIWPFECSPLLATWTWDAQFQSVYFIGATYNQWGVGNIPANQWENFSIYVYNTSLVRLYHNGTFVMNQTKGYASGVCTGQSLERGLFQMSAGAGTGRLECTHVYQYVGASCPMYVPPAVPVISNIGCKSCVPFTMVQPFVTPDTTPTINLTTDISATCGLSNSNSTFDLCSTTGSTIHTCTLADNKSISGNSYVYINCTASGLSGYSTANFSISTFSFLLDGVNANRSYELGSLINISASGLGGYICLSLDAPNYGTNYSCGNGTANFIYNASIERQTTFVSNGSSVNLSMDNRTDIISTQFNITSAGTTTNFSISYYGKSKSILGSIIGKIQQQTTFRYGGTELSAVNLSYLTAGSNYIYVNISDNPTQLKLKLWGFDLDQGNYFNGYEYFNETNNSKNWFNETTGAAYPFGIFENFEDNFTSSNWVKSSDTIYTHFNQFTSGYDNDFYRMQYLNIPNGVAVTSYAYENSQLDIRNITVLSIHANLWANSAGGTQEFLATDRLQIYDGVNLATIKQIAVGGALFNYELLRNFTIIREDTSSDIWKLYEDGAYISTISTSTLDDNSPWRIYLYTYASSNPNGAGTTSSLSGIYVYTIWNSGIWLNKSPENSTVYASTGNFTSDTIFNAANNIQAATLTAKQITPINTSISYYLSNNGKSYEIVSSGIRHVFASVGNNLSYRVYLNSTNASFSPRVTELMFNVIPSSANNFSLDLNDDGFIECNMSGILNTTNSPFNCTINQTIISGFAGQYIPIKISSATPALIQIDNFNLTSNINPIALNYSLFENCNNCQIDLSYIGNNLTVDDLRFDFRGSKNYTAIASSNGISANLTIRLLYSKFNLSFPKNVYWIDVFASSGNAKNVTPYGQTATMPIRNLTHKGYDVPLDLYVKTNATFPCLNVTLATNTSNSRILLNTSYQKINSNVSVGGFGNIFQWYSLNNCTARFVIPYFYYAATCTECVVDYNDFGNYNLLED